MSGALERLAELVEEASGNVVPLTQRPFLEQIAEQRARALSVGTVEAYVRALERGDLGNEWRNLLPLITVKESFLFRSPQQFRVIASELVPRLVGARAGTRRLRVWSAGCACGEEPATLALLLAEEPALAGWNWRILASDVDEDALASGRRGLYGRRAVSQVPESLLERYFTRRGEMFELSPRLRDRIEYVAINLISEPLRAPDPPYDVILLRNVLIYFNPDSQKRVAAAMAANLAEDGAFFVGPTETLWQISSALLPVDAGDCFYYRNPAPGETSPPPRRPAPAPQRPGSVPRVQPTPATPRSPSEPAHAVPGPVAGDDPRREEGARSGNRLVEAARRLAAGDVEVAATLVRAVLEAEPSDPTAHALEGVLHDVGGDAADAVAAYRATLYLQPDLFQVRYLLAESLRRSGWASRAFQEYRQTLASLAGTRERELDLPLGLPGRDEVRRRCLAALGELSGTGSGR